ncbi:DUF6232 family protein [Actinoplanes sp. NPDC051851]|uniref:DUF6232 family protein n=1 Tax=Actinoplanes sp. NPDC051851 TaxID=3154753 RepID=UPI00343489DA
MRDSSAGAGGAVRTYYRGPDALVTGEQFIRVERPAVSFTIRELRDVRVVLAPEEVSTYQHRVAALVIVPCVLVVAGAVWIGRVQVWAIAGVLVMLLGYTMLRILRPRRRWEMRATYYGLEVLIYHSRDTQVFNQVKRGLRRALEDRSDR